MNKSALDRKFSKFARRSAIVMGSPQAFTTAIALIIAWAISGFFVNFSQEWQLVANTTTTLVTTVMVLLVQSTQNRDSQAIQLKLNELIRSHEAARNITIALEDCDATEVEELRQEFKNLKNDE